MNNIKFIIVLLIAVILSAVTSFLVSHYNTSKVAYVKTYELLEKYKGMQEAKALYQKEYNGWKSNMDTLKLDYHKSLSKYTSDSPNLSDSEKEGREKLLQQQNENLVQYARMLDERAKEKEGTLTQGVLQQVDSFIKDYAKEKGYTAIIGRSNPEVVLYADESQDITLELLEALNKNYTGE